MNEITLEQALILLDESQQHNAAIVNRLYEIFNIDSSDGEVRAKWALLEASKVVKERDALAAQLAALHEIDRNYRDGDISQFDYICQNLQTLAATPQQHLTEVKAQAVKDFIEFMYKSNDCQLCSESLDKANQYIDSIRQEKK